MGYYASGSGQVVLKDKIPDEVCESLAEVFSDVEDAPDGGLWLTFEYDKYHTDDVWESLERLAPYVKDGNVTFTGEDCDSWRFAFYDGKVRYEYGRTVFEPSNKDERNSERLEMLGKLADIVEDWLTRKGITPEILHCDDSDDPDGALIYGCDYAELTDNFEDVLINYGLLEKER